MYVSRGPLRKVRSVNSNNAALPTLNVVEADISILDAGTAAGRSIIPLAIEPGGTGRVPRIIEFWPFSLGVNNDGYALRLIGWRRIAKDPLTTEQRQLWVPGILGDFGCTAGNFPGLAGFPIGATEFFADTLVQTNVQEPTKLGNTTLLDGFTKRYTPANDTPARAHVWLEGHEVIEFQFGRTSGTPTMNALYTFIDCVD